jgi:hypothetical protein
MEHSLVEVYTCGGGLEAETLRIFLESRGLSVMVSQESAGAAHGLTIGPLGMAHIFVPVSQAAEARAVLRAMEQGKFETNPELARAATGKRQWKKKVSKKKRS